MKKRVISVSSKASIEEAASIFVHHRIGTLPVVDDENRLIGMLRLRDLISLTMPDFVELVEQLDFVHDFGAVERKKPSGAMLNTCVVEIMNNPVYVNETAGLLRGAALLQEHLIYDLPVVDNEMRLVGIASYVDIGVALMSSWDLNNKSK